MVSWGDIRRWNDASLHPVVGRLNGETQKMTACSDELRDAHSTGGWSGAAADAAKAQADTYTDKIEETVGEASALRRGIGDVADALTGVLHGREEAEHLAEANHFRIGGDGRVVDNGPPPGVPGGGPSPGAPPPSPEQAAAAEQARQAKKAEVEAHVQQVLHSAEDVDNDLCAVLDRVLSGHAIDIGGDNAQTDLAAAGAAGAAAGALSVPDPPPGDADPVTQKAYWDSLSRNQQMRMLTDHPRMLGKRNGIPCADRDIANQNVLRDETTKAQSARDAKQAELDNMKPGGRTYGMRRSQLQSELDTLDKKLGALGNIRGRLDSTRNEQNPNKKNYLLGLNPDGDGKFIMAKGNPDTAKNVATYVPGMGTDLPSSFDHDDEADRADKMHQAARRAGSPSTSVITWGDADFPDGINNAMSNDYADDASKDLANFQDGLDTTHEGAPAHNTMIGHSYGSTTVGHTLRDQQPGADDAVFLASPGVGVDHANQLHMDPKHVHSSTGSWDMINATNNDRLPWGAGDPLDPLGPSPTDPEFGGKTFESSSDANTPWGAHSGYWDPNNPALKETGIVIAGKG